MANIKNGGDREIIIDRCLKSRRGYSTQEIFERCNEALERRGEKTINSLNTIRNDIVAIENRYGIVVEEVRHGREIKYRYKDHNFSIFNTPLNEEEIMQLTQSVSLLRRFEGMPGFEWVEEMNAHLQTTVSAGVKPVIGFDENGQLKGMRFFTPLFEAITSKKALAITYQPFKSENAITETIHPYYLKEYNQRWFLFALLKKDDKQLIANFALDRIKSIKKAAVKYIPNTTIDFAHYFDNVIGVSVNQDAEIQSVRLWVDKEQLPYILSKPIHKSQTVVEEREDGSAVIEIKVLLNFELEQHLLSFGERIEILSPTPFREKISARIKKISEKY